MSYRLTPLARADLSSGYQWIANDNPAAADAFLEAVKHTLERLERFPQFGPLARFKNKRLADIRFVSVLPPYQKWIVLYRENGQHVDVGRIIYGSMNWKDDPSRFL